MGLAPTGKEHAVACTMFEKTGKYAHETQWPCEVIECIDCRYNKEESVTENIIVQLAYACGHTVPTSIALNDIGPSMAEAEDEICPSCWDKKMEEHAAKEEESLPFDFHCRNLNIMDCGSCNDCAPQMEIPKFDRICVVCGALTNDESHCTQVTGIIDQRPADGTKCEDCYNVIKGCAISTNWRRRPAKDEDCNYFIEDTIPF